ncbi:phage protein NinX family protein [Serratia marcescens]|uniref:phage protein NinX family protein n=1 Tax=Serratia marcescens TaxID=615 RepID=UPI0007455884|nr:phage protein NinX family protein [Serratia marcescens]CVF68801.1 Protein of uncharacterised function (DUF2591) [Serratia marcescens]
MTDYSKMSDFEINKLVGIQLGVSPRKTICFISYKESDDIWPDYCNNPADAWPIIVENFIAILPPKDKRDINAAWVAYDDENSESGKMDPNPLRAAMIVFLMMKDAEKC